MITKSKLHEIEKFWKKLEKSQSSFDTVDFVKKIIKPNNKNIFSDGCWMEICHVQIQITVSIDITECRGRAPCVIGETGFLSDFLE